MRVPGLRRDDTQGGSSAHGMACFEMPVSSAPLASREEH